MKHIIFLTTLFFTFTLALPTFGQVPEVIPDKYERKYKRLERKTERLVKRDTPDVILHPIESLPIEPSFYALETGNWGPSFMGFNQRSNEIRNRAKRGVVVFIFDTGGCYDHPMLKDVTWNELGRSFTGEPCDDGHGHSTHVAGIIAASTDAYPLGIARMVPGIKVVPIKVLSNRGSGSFAWITEGTKYANAEAAKLIDAGWFVVYNYSLGGGSSYEPLEASFKEARELGVLINCAANGNTGREGVQYPGRSDYTLGIAALQQSGDRVIRANYSTFGPETWAAAPGSSILSTWPGGGTKILSGTSMATPHMAGLFAILAAIYPDADADALRAHFIEHADNLGAPGWDKYYGHGIGLANALLDNAPGGGDPPDEPDPPTCNDGKKNGDETGVDCGGPDCPPCEPDPDPEPDKPPYEKRKFVVALDGSWTLGWWQTGAASSEAVDFDLESTALVSPAGRTNITITRMVFEVESETEWTWEADALAANAARHFKNRAIGTPGRWDIRKAGEYVLFFFDYYLSRGGAYEKQLITPLEVEFSWEGYDIEIDAAGGLQNYKPGGIN